MLGTVVFVASIYWPLKWIYSASEKIHEYNREVTSFNLEYEELMLRVFPAEELDNLLESPTAQFGLATPLHAKTEVERTVAIQGVEMVQRQLRALSTLTNPVQVDAIAPIEQILGRKLSPEERSRIEAGLQEKLADFTEDARKLRVRQASIELLIYEIWELDDNSALLWKTVYVGGLFGSSLMLAGFVLWYRRVQRYQDAVLFRQATESPPEHS